MRSALALAGALAALVAAAPAHAAELRDLCPDRPAKGTAPCTVDQGHLQLEVDLADLTRDRTDGARTLTGVWAAPTLKYGMADDLDLEAAWTPYERLSVHEPAGARSHVAGAGDLILKAKLNPTGNPKAGPSVAIIPFLKAPTAAHAIGNGAWEEGVLGAFATDLPAGWSLNLTSEVDRLRNDSGAGRHAAASTSVGLTHGLGSGVSVTGEVWGQKSWDPGGHQRQASADVALAWTPAGRADLQIDLGVNVGVNRHTPDTQAYLGLSRRF